MQGLTPMARSRRVAPRFQRDSVQKLEDRIVLSADLLVQFQPHLPHAAQVQVVKAEPSRTIVSSTPASPSSGHTFLYKLNGASMTAQALSPPPGVLSPAQARPINEVDQVSDLGKGQTIAIVDADSDENVTSYSGSLASQSVTTPGGPKSYLVQHGTASTWLTKTWPSVVTPGKTASARGISVISLRN
jgi:hypothetical protein